MMKTFWPLIVLLVTATVNAVQARDGITGRIDACSG